MRTEELGIFLQFGANYLAVQTWSKFSENSQS